MTQPTLQQPKKKVSTSWKVALITIPVVFLAFIVLIIMTLLKTPDISGSGTEGGGDQNSVPLVANDSHVLDNAGEGAPVLVEFFDFECEACGMMYPVVEDLRKEYAGKVTFVTRYFLTNHTNSKNAAIAAEAAAKQGQYEQMFKKLYESQRQWGERQDSQADTFRGYAQELGLDMAAYDAAVADPATEARVQQDHDAGLALGVRGTPTFFLDGKQLELQMFEDLGRALDTAVSKTN